jgi:NADH-ubiquinone oxidoreductase chain 5
MYLSIIFLPLLASATAGLLGRKLGNTGAQIITISSLAITSVMVIIAFYEVGLCASPVYINLPTWIDSGLLNVSWSFSFDSLSVVMLIPILIVSTFVQIYTVDYMREDPHPQRFFSYLTLFSFFMILLVTADNYLLMFLAWEGVGVVSFLLINFWFTRIAAGKAAVLALTQNRVGDTLLTLGLFGIFWLFGNLDYVTVFSIAPYMNETVITIIALLLLGGASAKSAQLLLNTWLPHSMEGPTPVSSLLHAATLVVCGIYLLVRSSPLLEWSPTALLIITWIGAVTSIFAASSGLLQNDLKRIIAFSTISQLGYMFMAIGLSQYDVALLHMSSHAFFKALLFLSAGAIIHSLSDVQDIRKMGGLQQFLPFVYSAVVIGSLSLMALPWMSGFYSKDLIIELAYAQYTVSGFTAYTLGTITAALTAFYSFRLISLVFLSYPNAPRVSYLNVHEASIQVIIPLVVLSLFSIFFGYIFSDLFVGMGSDFFAASVFTHPNHITLIEAEFSLPLHYKLLPSIVSILGAAIAIYLYNVAPRFLIDLTESKVLGSVGRKLYTFFNGKYFLDVILNQAILAPGMKLGYTITKVLDRGVIEAVGPYGLTSLLGKTGYNIAKLDTGIVTTYALYIVLGLISILFIIFLPVFVQSGLSVPTSTIITDNVTEIRLVLVLVTALLFATQNKNIAS